MYLWEAKIDIGTEWICNPAKLDFPPNPQGSRNEDQRHKRWLKFLNTYDRTTRETVSNYIIVKQALLSTSKYF